MPNPPTLYNFFIRRYAERLNLPVLEHVTLPRVGAMRIIMENVGYLKSNNPTFPKGWLEKFLLGRTLSTSTNFTLPYPYKG